MRRFHVAVLLPILVGPAFAQLSYPNCSAGWNWSYNSLGQNPCNVAADLEATCNGGQFEIPQLQSGHLYRGPDSGSNNLCQCNTVLYSLVSACSACQGSSWIQWSAWSFNCSVVSSPTTYPKLIPNGTRVPYWAYLNVTTAGTWDVAAAQKAGDSPEGIPGVPSTIAPVSTASSAPHSSSSSSSKQDNPQAGQIAGIAVGGVVGTALVTALIIWYLRRRRRRSEAQPSPYMDKAAHMAAAFGLPEYDTSKPVDKFYDPSDPSTFPKSFGFSPSATVIQTSPNSEQGDSAGSLRPAGRSQYSGLPLV
ncbi:hypothetical protein BJV74DRAFT_595309 [Russula compacta]|nr:hypothetical protein BJV74DRAFT_595309 [Russula compacta]